MLSGRSTAATMRFALSSARSNGSFSPSSKPFAAATDQLPVASAAAPPAAIAFALPASHTFNRTTGLPRTCSARKAWAFSFCVDMIVLSSRGRGALRQRLRGREPMFAQFAIEIAPALFGEENPRAVAFDATARARDRIRQPASPFRVEIDIVRAPGDQGRRRERAQRGLDAQRVLRVERGEEARQVLCALRRLHMRTQVGF